MRTQHNFNHRPHYRPFILKLWVFLFTQRCNIFCSVTDQRADTELVVCLSKEQFYYQQAGVRLKAVLRRITGVCVCICVSVCVSQLTSMPRKLEISPLCLMWEESWVGAFVHTLVLSCSYLLFCVCVCLCVSLFFTHSLQSVFTFVHSVCVCCTGGILAGVISDKLGKRATTCAIMLLLAAPTVSSISDTLFWRDLMSEHVLDQDVQSNT